MPRKHIDYSKTYIYRLTCKTPNVLDMFISFTTNIIQRKHKHKRESLDLSIQTKLYQHIRKYGGWRNWTLDILEECVCLNELKAKERTMFYILKYNPTLNDEIDTGFIELCELIHVSEPTKNHDIPLQILTDKHHEGIPLEYLPTDDCKYTCSCKKSYSHRSSYYKHTNSCLHYQHIKTAKIGEQISYTVETTDNIVSNCNIYNCDVPSSVYIHPPKKTTYKKRVVSSQIIDTDFVHKEPYIEMTVANYESITENPEEVFSNETYPTFPNIKQKRRKLKFKECQEENDSTASSVIIGNNIDPIIKAIEVTTTVNNDEVDNSVSDLLSQQNEKLTEYIRQMMSLYSINKGRNKKSLVNSLVFELLDQNKTLQKQIIELSKERNIVVNNTNNNQFNLNFFLNEQCKDAVNLTDFVNSLEITIDDLTYTRNQGLVEGISKVMIDGLKQMDIYKRPIHCTDQKRDTIYIKDNHQWARDEGNIRLKKAFVDIANKEYFAIKMWMDSNPNWESNSSLQDFHHKMIKSVLHEIKDDPVGERKILKNIEREIFIEK
jgi:hypothetical protein